MVMFSVLDIVGGLKINSLTKSKTAEGVDFFVLRIDGRSDKGEAISISFHAKAEKDLEVLVPLLKRGNESRYINM